MTYPPPQGWDPYLPPGGYPPPAGFPPSPGYPPKRDTNPLAIASLVCSIAGLVTCALTSVVGLILGIVAMSQIKRTGDEGRGMALAGVIVGGVITALTVIGLVLYFAFFVWLATESSYDYSSY